MSLEVKIHDAQMVILRELLFHPSAGFAELQKNTHLTSDHFNFHINRLVELGLVEKIARGHYSLSSKGKEYANRLDMIILLSDNQRAQSFWQLNVKVKVVKNTSFRND